MTRLLQRTRRTVIYEFLAILNGGIEYR